MLIGPAFFPAGHRPQAPCPVCVKEKGDKAEKQLFSLRGFNEGEHDPAIPRCWFKAPPMKLEGKDKEMEALRVCLVSLHSQALLMIFSFNIWLSRATAGTLLCPGRKRLRKTRRLRKSFATCGTSSPKEMRKPWRFKGKSTDCDRSRLGSRSYRDWRLECPPSVTISGSSRQ